MELYISILFLLLLTCIVLSLPTAVSFQVDDLSPSLPDGKNILKHFTVAAKCCPLCLAL